MEEFKGKALQIIDNIAKFEEQIKMCINIIAYTYIYFSLFYLIKIGLFNVLKSTNIFMNLFLLTIYILMFIFTFKIKKNVPYMLILYILVLQFFL